MAYNPYTSKQINDFIGQKGIANDPWAMYNFRQQYNVDPAAVDAARGWGAGTSQGFMDQAQKTLAGPIAGMRELDTTNPHMAYALAQQSGSTAGQADARFGNTAGTSASWAQGQGLTGFGAPTASAATGGNLLGLGAAPGPANNSPANPYLQAGAGASTTGSTPATMPATGPGNGAVGVPDYLVSPGSNQPGGRNPYMPGGTQGNDPRVGGPGRWGNTGMGGLARYLSDNPHMLAMGNEITRGVNNNLQRNILPGIGDQFSGSGTYGGSRHGVAEGLATGEAMSGLAGALANLYGGQFNQDRQHTLANDALDFQVHRGNLQDMRTGQLDQLDFLGRMEGWNRGAVGVANQTRDRPFTDWQRFVGPASQMAGLGGSETQNQQGNPLLGLIGGWLAGTKGFGG